MVSQEDCDDRSNRYLDNLFEKCESCFLKQIECHSNIDKRYSRLFQGHSTYTTYLSLERGHRYERNGRMVIWGLTAAEAELVCKKIKDKVKEKYSGSVRCVAGRVS